MSAPTTIPLSITPEAAEQLARLGMQPEFDRMIEHVRQVVPHLARIEVTLNDRGDLAAPGEPPGISIEAFRTDPYVREDRVQWEIWGWKVRTFPPEVNQHFLIVTQYEEPDHAG
jgi:hypothetical protein